MDKKIFGIGILSLMAVVLVLANYFVATPSIAIAQQVVKDRDYQLVTARVSQGGDALYITDNRTGLMAVFSYDPTSRTVRARTARPISDAFIMGK